ncbi:hypothetical protein AXG93_4360s1350 [Marchantia polymorpha subsp. ruderalis]|uniref:Uncharacterized protein n=1 Tax=Marchantia polymorpha subsp. ruderalis TaxID=1480154 RepID=A0A176W1E0_MARPO|nr:hypothetical protein AXG93_4360s1350 [Marchantia polymorpha subsp. ruderalis]
MGEQDVNHAHCLDSGCLCCGIYSTNCVELHRRQKVNSRGGCASTSTAKYSCPAPPTDFAHVISNSRSNPSATSTQSPTPTPLPDPLSMHAVEKQRIVWQDDVLRDGLKQGLDPASSAGQHENSNIGTVKRVRQATLHACAFQFSKLQVFGRPFLVWHWLSFRMSANVATRLVEFLFSCYI